MNKNFTLPNSFKSALSSKSGYKKRSRLINPGLLSIMIMLFSFIKTEAQTGLINDDFATGSTFNWIPATTGSTGLIQNGKYLINFPAASGGKYRADFRKNGGITFHAGNYPIIAIKITKPPRCNYFFDTNLGAYNNVNNNGTKIETASGNVYYWDLSTGKLGTTTLSTTQPTTLSSFQLKIADIVLTQEEIDANKTNYEVSWVKSFASVDALRSFLNPSGTINPQFEFSGTFVHPGLLHNTADLTRIKDLVTRKVSRPYQSYQLLLASGKASATYVMKGPYSSITRDATLTIDGTAGGSVKNNVESDFMAAYYNALMYQINGNEAHALKAIQIIDAYSAVTKSIIGTDSELNGLYGFILTNAAEIMRSTYPAWPADKVLQCQNMLKSVFYPVIGNFKPCSHGNWDIICMKALMAISVFTDDIPTFNKTINYYYYGEGNGSIKRYVLTDAGQLQESNRDQPHVMLAIGSLAELAEMALKQGIDLYSANNNAILRGFEYTSQYNLGFDVPYQTSYDYCEKNFTDYAPTAISPTGRGEFRSVFEIAYNHYVYRKGIPMPQTQAVLGQMGPEGAPFGADNPGYGSLLFYLNTANDHPFPNAGLINDNFEDTTDSWKAVTSGSVASSENGQLKITTVVQTGGKSRGDMQKNNTTVHPGNFPILAIKMKKPANCNFTLDTNLGSYGNGANKWTGKVGEEIYYYDLSKTGFGATPTLLSATDATTLTTFQFKVADIASGETSYTVDWVKTVKSLAELTALDPTTGLINDNFTTTTEGWTTTTTGATSAADAGHLRVNLSKQSNGSYRGDIKRTAGATLYPANYPIVAIKLKKPTTVNITFDTNLGSFGNGSNKWTGKVGNDIYYFDLSKTGFGTGSTLSTPTALTTFQFKIADITSGETNYQVDWIKTVKTVAELQALIAPAYQTIVFPTIDTKKVGDADIDTAVASSGLKITYSSSNENIATIVNGKIHITATGTAEITAAQTGDANYYPADIVKRNLVVIKNDQFISFNPLSQKTIDAADFNAGATASSELAISYTSSNENVVTIVNGLIHIIGAGTSEIIASQTGNDTYNTAPSITQSLTVTKTFYTDEDHDGFGSTSATLLPVNIAPEGYATNNTDCNDSDATVHQPIQYYVDADKDGFGSTTTAMLCASTAPDGYATNNTDCNDNDATVHQPIQYYVDTDKDGFGSNVTAMLCTSVAPQGYATNNTDCNDSDATVHESIQYYVDADKDGFGSTTTAMLCASTAPEGYATNNTDCNDNDATVHQPIQYYVDADKDGFGSTTTAMLCSSTAPEGYATNNTDCNDNDATVHQPIQYYVDADKDGFGSTTTAMLCTSTAPEGYATDNTDCNDNDATVHQPIQYYVDADKDGFGSNVTAMLCTSVTPQGYATNNTDCDDTNAVQLTATIPNVYALNAAVDEKNTIYIGYGPTSLSISATPAGGTAPYAYKWSTNQTAKTIAVSAVGTYTVIVTDAKGCQTTTSIVIKTINVQCGNSGDKVMVCHNGQQICVSSNAVQAHLNHGDKLGSCSYMVNKATEKDLISEENATEDVSVYPNPVTSLLNVKVNEVQSGATLELYNSIGMKVLSQTLKSTSEVMSLDTLPSGIYLLKINNGNETTVKNIIKE
ncbi:MAG: hypothetical protein RLZZ540_1765 [Bacteroidota bacterium]|jgi:pyridoxal/pyridoxine/pyridoxamine kinase